MLTSDYVKVIVKLSLPDTPSQTDVSRDCTHLEQNKKGDIKHMAAFRSWKKYIVDLYNRPQWG